MKRVSSKLILFLGVGTAIVVADFLLKIYSLAHIPPPRSSIYPYGGIPVFHNFLGINFSLNTVANRGAAWGMFSDWPAALCITRLVLIGALIVYFFLRARQLGQQIALILIIAGAIGNLIDFFLYGHVVDMFNFTFWSYSYPVFNLADTTIFCGICLLAVQSLRK